MSPLFQQQTWGQRQHQWDKAKLRLVSNYHKKFVPSWLTAGADAGEQISYTALYFPNISFQSKITLANNNWEVKRFAGTLLVTHFHPRISHWDAENSLKVKHWLTVTIHDGWRHPGKKNPTQTEKPLGSKERCQSNKGIKRARGFARSGSTGGCQGNLPMTRNRALHKRPAGVSLWHRFPGRNDSWAAQLGTVQQSLQLRTRTHRDWWALTSSEWGWNTTEVCNSIQSSCTTGRWDYGRQSQIISWKLISARNYGLTEIKTIWKDVWSRRKEKV